jgi:hypothetical protein
MSVKVLVRVDRKAALKAIRMLDALSHALAESDAHWSKKLKRKYRDARGELVDAIRHLANCNGIADPSLSD